MALIPVRVAVRCRPLVSKEILEGCQNCVSFIDNENQVIVGKDRAFTFDFTFGPESSQDEVFSLSVTRLVEGLFKGYNATILAYGQTGSGKTYTMGTNYSSSSTSRDVNNGVNGIIPRAIEMLFRAVEERHQEESITTSVSFIEIYKEDLNDLLRSGGEPLVVRDDVNGGVKLPGLKEERVSGPSETLHWLEQGSSGRTTGSTAMNAESSRSHAIFTISITRTNKTNKNDVTKAKFHLVDLAGSERIKKTHAEGERLKEGININKGLLSLGNVISALGEDRGHIPYRDSKLTRLLQDSLGGNSHTLMIACVSPADSNLEETLNTLRYADRARKIKNKPVINRDPQMAEILRLKQMVQELQCQLIGSPITPSTGTGTGTSTINGLNSKDLETIKVENRRLRDENHQLAAELQQVVTQNADMCEKVMLAEMARDELVLKIEQLKEQAKVQIQTLNESLADHDDVTTRDQLKSMMEIEKSIHQLEVDIIQSAHLDDVTEDSQDEDEVTKTTDDVTDDNVVSTEHALRQARMGRELGELNNMLLRKQQLAATMASNENRMCDMKSQYETTMSQLESEVTTLQKEREILVETLENVKANTASNRVSEQRRKRLHELESQLSSLKRRIQEQERTIKIKDQSVTKVGKLNNDIQEMKRQRVKLVKQMREDSDQFRKWKQAKDKEVMQLKAKDRKRQFEMVRKDNENATQLAVLRRKAGEAAAANKRLKEALQKKKTAQEERGKQQERSDGAGIGKRVRTFLRQELEVQESVAVAKHHLDSLLADRKELNKRLNRIKESEPPAKKRSMESGATSSMDIKTELQIRETESELQLRNAQIADLQQKLMEAENEESRSKFNPHTMVEAKCAIKFLMEAVVVSKTELSKTNSKLCVEKENVGHRDVVRDELTSQVRDLQHELLVTQQEYEAKISDLLRMESEHKPKMAPPKPSINRKPPTKSGDYVTVEQDLPSSSEEDLDSGDEWEKTPMVKVKAKRRRPLTVTMDTDRPRQIQNKTSGCSCKLGCRTKRCSCRSGGMSCADWCKCNNCINTEAPSSTTQHDESKISAETSSILQTTELNSTFNVDSSLDDFQQPMTSLTSSDNILSEINSQTVTKKRLQDDPLEEGVKRKRKLLTPKRFFDDPSIIDENLNST